MDNKKKLSKCIIIGGKELLKELGIDFQETEIERNERTSEMFKIKEEKEGEKKENGINRKF